jgi:hypothetical protein
MQEELNILTEKLSERAHTELPLNLRPRHKALNFPEQQMHVVIAQKKLTSRPPPFTSPTRYTAHLFALTSCNRQVGIHTFNTLSPGNLL